MPDASCCPCSRLKLHLCLRRHSVGAVTAVLLTGVTIKKCRYLESSGCVGMCTNMCKLPTQRFFTDTFGAQHCPLAFPPACPPLRPPGILAAWRRLQLGLRLHACTTWPPAWACQRRLAPPLALRTLRHTVPPPLPHALLPSRPAPDNEPKL